MPTGTYPYTGVGGLTLGAGYGYLSRLYGLSIDNLIELEVVLPNGTIVIANDQNEYSDLIWACRGGGGNFGVVTKFTFKVHKLPPNAFFGLNVYMAPTVASAVEIFKNFDKLYSELPNNVGGMLILPAGAPVVPTVWYYFGDKSTPAEVSSILINL